VQDTSLNQNTEQNLNKWFSFFLLAGIVLNAMGLFNAILEPDGTLYATLAKRIAITNDWVNLFAKGNDWLDKPHFPFWVTALSFKILGYTGFAYKLPSFLFWLAGVYYTYLLALKLYNKTAAQVTVIIYITALHVLLSNFDVRAEGYLTTLIIAATYHILCAAEKKYSWHILYAALYCACAMMTKGIFALVTIASGFVFYWIKTKQWKEFREPRWYILFALSFLFTFPELYCLYVQFDLHPEKVVYGTTNVSGVKFFFWDSQFGRFFNNGPIKGKGNPIFFFHTILWAFLPWSLLLYIAVINLFIKAKSVNPQRLIISIAALVSFIMFSVSRFQLPYYILIIFPHFAMLTGNWLGENNVLKKYMRVNIMLSILFFILVVLSLSLVIILHAFNIIFFVVVLVVCCIAYFVYRKNVLVIISWKAICFSFLLSAFLNISFYPTLMQYQSGMQAGKWLNAHEPGVMRVTMYRCIPQTSFPFYSHAEITYADTLNANSVNLEKPVILYGEKKNIDSLAAKGFNVSALQAFPYFHISELTVKFISYKTRNAQLQTFELAEVSATKSP
jgi:4-amino-4-deoxy-L-arabinose transferase-like glycosyltransferase